VAALTILLTSSVLTGAAGHATALPPSGPAPGSTSPAPQLVLPEGRPAAIVPLDLPAVSRLVEAQNAQVAIARARLNEAYAEKYAADQRCLKAAERLEAEGKIWQQRLELSRVASETDLDATGTYVDLLAARMGEAYALAVLKDTRDLLERAEKVVKTEPGWRVEVESIQTQLAAQQGALVQLRERTAAASARLAYLLGLEPGATLVLVYDRLQPFQLVDASPPESELLARALALGPGVREMEDLVNFVEHSVALASGTCPLVQHLVPKLRGRVGVAQAKLETTLLAQKDLRGKLTLGVQEAREAILRGREQIRLAEERLGHARRLYELSHERSKNPDVGGTFREVLLSLQALSLAQAEYLNALRSYNKAQLRLRTLLGPVPTGGGLTER
jgi:outer membrane protein TolC